MNSEAHELQRQLDILNEAGELDCEVAAESIIDASGLRATLAERLKTELSESVRAETLFVANENYAARGSEIKRLRATFEARLANAEAEIVRLREYIRDDAYCPCCGTYDECYPDCELDAETAKGVRVARALLRRGGDER